MRPVSVTVICWVIIALGFEGAAATFTSVGVAAMNAVAGEQISVPKLLIFSGVMNAIYVALALLMLSGANWARVSFILVYGLVAFCSLFAIGRVSSVLIGLALIKLCIYGYFLLRSEAQDYFTGSSGAAVPAAPQAAP